MVGGGSRDIGWLDSIERWDVGAREFGWTTFTIEGFRGRSWPLVSQLNEKELLVAGGFHSCKTLSDIYAIDPEEQTMRTVAAKGPIELTCVHNQTMMTKNGQVYAMVKAGGKPHIVHFS